MNDENYDTNNSTNNTPDYYQDEVTSSWEGNVQEATTHEIEEVNWLMECYNG